ncbi:ATPase, T2SS/T4P/T4SS family [Selenomonas noxia]|uniref:ATPase, T2SS/T4P/T4SS family n=1 Tax=Selenomonas noxia TaxID=135083 RepID=UPI0028D40470|nr:ATPase, T2SS/T4P/T4SS family [Selenomonas noxia]
MGSENPNFDVVLGADAVTLMNRDDITEIYVNDDGKIWYNSHEEGKVKTAIYLTPGKARAIIELAAGQAGKIVNEDVPSISVEIQGYGARFQGEIPPIVRNPQFNIRKKAVKVYSLQEYVDTGFMAERYKDFLEDSIRARKNILVVGGTGTGKTTFLNAILSSIAEISPYHRLISLEDIPELQCPADDYSPMFTKQDTGDSKIRYNMTRLLADCMRRSPDRIVVGEVRDGAAYTMLKAWNTGHPGGACTVHADDAEKGLTRIKSLAQEDRDAAGDVKELIGEAIDVVVSIQHVELPDGRKSRIISDIIEVDSYDSAKQQYKIRHI